jgi:hypothetical protein
MPDLPSGTATFLFTDIEGSIAPWERVRGNRDLGGDSSKMAAPVVVGVMPMNRNPAAATRASYSSAFRFRPRSRPAC